MNFKPWIGVNYATSGFLGKKILVLGESHYCKEELAESGKCHPICSKDKMEQCCFDQTIDNLDSIVYYLDRGERDHRTFLNFENAIFGRDLRDDHKTRESFWNSVMFYNYFGNDIHVDCRFLPLKYK